MHINLTHTHTPVITTTSITSLQLQGHTHYFYRIVYKLIPVSMPGQDDSRLRSSHLDCMSYTISTLTL